MITIIAQHLNGNHEYDKGTSFFSPSGLARLDKGAKPADWITISCTTTRSNQCVVIETGGAYPEIRLF